MDNQFCIELQLENLNVSKAIEFVSSENCGATSIFIGTTRINENNGTGKVQSLYYEAYEEMALKIMHDMARKLVSDQIDGKMHRIFICHKLGEVKLGDASIIIAVSSPHRLSGHQMVMDILNEIKKQVPIWKKVIYQTSDDLEISNKTEFWSENSQAFWLEKNQ